MAVLLWPTGLKAPARASPGVLPVQIVPEALGPIRDIVHRYMLRTLTLEWDNMTNAQFAQVDALVDYLEGKRNTIKAPWRPYQAMVGGGTSVAAPTLVGEHAAGSTSLSTTGWGGTNPILLLGDWIQISSGIPRIHRVMGTVNRSGAAATIPISPPTWVTYATGQAMLHANRVASDEPYGRFLQVTMELADPSQIMGQTFISPQPNYGRGIVISFVEAHRTVY